MSAVKNNPCLACSTNQHCCSRVSGLLLSEDEFRRHFLALQDELSVHRSGKIIIISAKNGGPCPHWRNNGCRIYRHRPIDCRVFPYVPTHFIDTGNRVKIAFHGRADCPQKENLFLSEAEVQALLMTLGRQMYGENSTIIVKHEKGIISQVCNRIEAAISRRLNRFRSR